MPKFTIENLLLLSVAPFFVFMLNVALIGLLGYDKYSYLSLDSPLHFLGGVSIALSAWYGLNLLEKFGYVQIKSYLLKILLIIFTVTTGAVFWEMYEFVNDIIFGTTFQASLWDTMKDLILGALGGAITGSLLFFRNTKK